MQKGHSSENLSCEQVDGDFGRWRIRNDGAERRWRQSGVEQAVRTEQEPVPSLERPLVYVRSRTFGKQTDAVHQTSDALRRLQFVLFGDRLEGTRLVEVHGRRVARIDEHRAVRAGNDEHRRGHLTLIPGDEVFVSGEDGLAKLLGNVDARLRDRLKSGEGGMGGQCRGGSANGSAEPSGLVEDASVYRAPLVGVQAGRIFVVPRVAAASRRVHRAFEPIGAQGQRASGLTAGRDRERRVVGRGEGLEGAGGQRCPTRRFRRLYIDECEPRYWHVRSPTTC